MMRSIARVCCVGLAIVAVPEQAVASSLDRDTCNVHRFERDQLVAAGVKNDMSGGPAAFRALATARQRAVRRYIQVEETLLFRCARYLPQLPKEATPVPVATGSAAAGPAKPPVKPPVKPKISEKQQKLMDLRARLAAEQNSKVRRLELSKPGSTSKVFEEEMKAAWKKRLASFRRGDPLGAQPPQLPSRSPLQRRKAKPAPVLRSVPSLPRPQRVPDGIPETSLPIKDSKKAPAKADSRKTAQAAVTTRPATASKPPGNQAPSLFRGSIFSLPPGKSTKGWDKSIFDSN